MERQEIIDQLRAIIQADEHVEVDVSGVTEATRLDGIGFDSISILEFMYEIESRFSIELDVADLVEFVVVSDLIDHLEKKIAA